MMEDLSFHILDIAENSVVAGATRIAITINENQRRNLLTIRISDNGRGMSKNALRRALDPFFSTKGKATGLGLPLLAQAAEFCDGGLSIASAPGKGTTVTVRFRMGHVDLPPLTRMAETMSTLVLSHPNIDFRYRHARDGRVFRFGLPPRTRRAITESGLRPDIIGTVESRLRSGLRRLGRT